MRLLCKLEQSQDCCHQDLIYGNLLRDAYGLLSNLGQPRISIAVCTRVYAGHIARRPLYTTSVAYRSQRKRQNVSLRG